MDTFLLAWGFLALCLPGSRGTADTAQPCGGRLNSKDAGYITSPGYPNDYPSHQNCEWVIYAPEANQKIILNFNPHFEIEKHDCKYDFIEIRDGDSEAADLLGKHCGNIAPPTIISSGSSLYIKFTSDYARQGAGFSLRYEIYKTGSEDCSRNFTASNGTIESPGFPDKYPHNLDCVFTIIAKPKTEILLHFLLFDLEHDPLQAGEGDCKYDWLDIWDGIPQVGPLIGRYCGTKMPSDIRSTTGVLSLTFHTDLAVAKDGFSAQYYLIQQEVPENFQCNVPLGMESGRISNMQISASSTYSDGRWTPQQSRLNSDDNGWTPNVDSNKEYLQVDLHFLTVLTAIATQGAISRETQNGYYVRTYKLEVSTNGEDWMMYRHGKNHKTFQANEDATEVVLNKIHSPVLTRFVRIRPQTWHNGIALRLELYGCRITDSPCSNLLGMLSGLIPDSQISASSIRGYDWSPSMARLVSSRSGWFPRVPQAQPGEEWLQVDLGVPKNVKGVIIQGARGGDSVTTTESRSFVKKFKVAYSMNGKDWDFIQDPKTMQAKLFEGNIHYDIPEVRRFDPVPAQYVRVHPERWSPAGIGMRLEVLGCDWTDVKPTAETLVPTLKSEETTTPYPTDEEATECGDSCGEEEDFHLPANFNCNFDLPEDLCGWSHDLATGYTWSFQPTSTWIGNSEPSPETVPDGRNYLQLQSSGRREGQRARLVSPTIYLPRSAVCMVFHYQAWGSNGVMLRVWREASQEHKALWVITEDQGEEWREGRIILPSYDMEYRIVFEGFIRSGHSGELALDDIRLGTDIPLENCMEPITAFPVNFPRMEDDFPIPEQDFEDNDDTDYFGSDRNDTLFSTNSPGTPKLDKEKSWLYTLDPILVTIIAMSSLGVLLGAICAGLLLYCTCSYAGLSSRSSTTLENYNFELYDGIKHKVKMNHQKCCSEA
ncbi:neuropilin-2 isoform X2 [Anas platyrhynchos]|uniref:Neuropilin n=2 Tax=Anas TaxID=8835 RepID=U3I4X8_ANAPP|nr:neuropilin-2 isoform X2 [Anas platyrhynchos]|eukprot:XP_005016891.1 neuropilin-2 isoform X3 [Anas platyrhynchos]